MVWSVELADGDGEDSMLDESCSEGAIGASSLTGMLPPGLSGNRLNVVLVSVGGEYSGGGEGATGDVVGSIGFRWTVILSECDGVGGGSSSLLPRARFDLAGGTDRGDSNRSV